MNDITTTWSPTATWSTPPDLDDDAGAFVAAEHREAGHRDAAGHQVMVEWHMPDASIWTLTSSFCGSPISIPRWSRAG